ncbi:hypothetical protein J6590_009556, partial [Homalodisca vitripennis]
LLQNPAPRQNIVLQHRLHVGQVYSSEVTHIHLPTQLQKAINYFPLGDISAEMYLWYNFWGKEDLPGNKLKDIKMAAFMDETNFPPRNKACTPHFKCFPNDYGYCSMIFKYPLNGNDLAEKSQWERTDWLGCV